MAYKVIKKVKGHYYLYIQRSWRESGAVKTESHYLGKVDKEYASKIKRQKQKKKESKPAKEITQTIKNTKSDVAEILIPESGIESIDVISENSLLSKNTSFSINRVKNVGSPVTMSHQISFLSYGEEKKKIRIDYPYLKIKIQAKLSHSSLWEEYRQNIKKLSKKYDLKKKPKITIKTGDEIGIKRRGSLNYIITVSEKRGVTHLVQEEYSKIFDRVELDLMKEQNPIMYDKVKAEFQDSLRNTKRYLKEFVKNHDNHSEKRSYNAAISIFNYSNEIKKTKKGKSIIDKDKLGISAYGKLSFENEFSYLKKQNLTSLKKKTKSKIRACKSAISKHEKKKVSILKKPKQKRDIKLLKSRIKLHNEMLKRVKVFEKIK